MPIEIEGLGPILKKIDSLGKPAVFKTPMKQSMEYLMGKLGDEVPKAPGAFTALATEGQRKAYWAKVSKDPSMHGPGGYQRTHDTRRGWKYKISDGGRTGRIGNQMPGAPYLYGAPDSRQRQTRYHARSGWPRVDLVAKKAAPIIVGYFQKALERAMKK